MVVKDIQQVGVPLGKGYESESSAEKNDDCALESQHRSLEEKENDGVFGKAAGAIPYDLIKLSP